MKVFFATIFFMPFFSICSIVEAQENKTLSSATISQNEATLELRQ